MILIIYMDYLIRVFGIAIATSSFLNLLLPVAADSQPIFLIFVRVLQGLVEVSLLFKIFVHSFLYTI